MATLTAAVGVLTGIVAGIGVFARGDGSTVLVTSMRGETYPMVTNGVYAWNAERVVAEGIGWDMFTLYVVAPAMLLVAPFLARGSFRARLVAIGLYGYVFYQYLMYAMTWAFGPLFLPFVVLFAAAVSAIVWIAPSVARDMTPTRFSTRFPRRSMAALCIVVSFAITAMWLRRIVAGLHGDLAGAMLLGETTLVVQALDLGLVVPLSIYTAVMALKRRPLGYVLASVFAVKAFAMASAICAMVLAAARVEHELDAGGLAFFGGAALVALVLEIRMLAATRERPTTALDRPDAPSSRELATA